MSVLLEWVDHLSKINHLSGPYFFWKKIKIKHFKSKNDTKYFISQISLICHKLNLFRCTYNFPIWWKKNPWSPMENKSLPKKTFMVKHKLEQNSQHINKTQCNNTLVSYTFSPKILEYMLNNYSVFWTWIWLISTHHTYNKENIWSST